MLAGRAAGCHANMARAELLSPLDPLMCALQSCDAPAYLQEGRLQDSAQLAVVAARAPQAHIVIQMDAVVATWLAGDFDAARHWTKVILGRRPDASVARDRWALPSADKDFSRTICAALKQAGLPEQ